jgi:hypothetical protein
VIETMTVTCHGYSVSEERNPVWQRQWLPPDSVAVKK